MIATCPACHRPMNGSSCNASAWRLPDDTLAPRKRVRDTPTLPGEDCNDCGAPPDGHHHQYCDMDVCAHDRQALTCDDCELDVPGLVQ